MSDEGGQNEFVYESQSDLVIGIDFGTTFSGVAWALAVDITSMNDPTKIVEKINVIKAWPGHGQAEKIPTVLSYNTSPPSWGFKVKPTDNKRVGHFKLGLQRNVREYYATTPVSKTSILGGYLTDHNWQHPELPGKKALDFTADYLKGITTYVSTQTLARVYAPEFLQGQKVSYVITVPAIWGNEAKELTKEAAERAGILRRNLLLITEPEAAALYCARLCNQADIKVGDRFLICDAGGGTVDLIAYKVLEREPLLIEECTIPTGAACGSVYLDQGFENLIRNKLGNKADSIINIKVAAEISNKFDTIKRQFDYTDSEGDSEYEIQLRNAPEMPHIGLEEGYLKIPRAEIQSVFEPIFKQILGLIKKQITTVRTSQQAKIKTLFLVGGLGSNTYLWKFLQENLKPMIVIQPLDGITAIMRGAVIHKIDSDSVKSRRMPKSYGVTYNVEFRHGHHPVSRKIEGLDGITRCKDVMDWYVRKNDQVDNGKRHTHPFFRNISPAQYRAKGPLEHRIKLHICDDPNPPAYHEASSIIPLCDLSVDLKALPTDAMSERTGPKGTYYRVDYDLEVSFGPAGIEFKFLYKGRIRGSVAEKYS